MHKFFSFLCCFLGLFFSLVVFSQSQDRKEGTDSTKNWKISDLKRRSNDHLIVEFGMLKWLDAPSQMGLDGFHHYYNFSFFYDMPFKTNPHFSVAPGLSLGFNRVYMNQVHADLTSTSSVLTFQNVSNTTHYASSGIFYTTLAAQMELRYISNPLNSERSFKVATGIRLGWIISAHNHDVDRLDASGNKIAEGTFESYNTKYFDFPATIFSLRVGYGVLSVVGTYQVNGLFTKASGVTAIHPFSIGLALGGL